VGLKNRTPYSARTTTRYGQTVNINGEVGKFSKFCLPTNHKKLGKQKLIQSTQVWICPVSKEIYNTMTKQHTALLKKQVKKIYILRVLRTYMTKIVMP
jgi:hypothetical protein